MSLLSICLSLAICVLQVPQPSILESLLEKSSQECLVVDYGFETVISGMKTKGEGVVEIQGNSYHMTGSGVEIYCDGSSTWLIDASAKEVIIEAADSQSAGYLANPAMLLLNLQENPYKVDGNKITLEVQEGTSLDIFINDAETVPIKKSEAFRPPTEFDSTWIVTDLR